MKTALYKISLLAAILLIATTFDATAQGWINSVLPKAHSSNISRSTNIAIVFTQALDSTSLTDRTIRIAGSQYGLYQNNQVIYDTTTKRVIINPARDFAIGELVSVSLTSGIKNTLGDSLTTPYVWSFRIQATEGTSKFKPAINSGPSGWVYAFSSADFDSDGLTDLAVNVYQSSILIFKNKSSGIFNLAQRINANGEPECSAVGDFDNDGDMDLAIGLGQSFRLLMNDGKGVFNLSAASYFIQGHVYKIFTADLNGDGYLDLAIPGEWSNSIHVFLNKGDGSFNPDMAYMAGDHVREVAIGDFDNDGDLDMVANSIQQSSAILLNNGKGVFNTQTLADVQMVSLVAGDFNADGKLDFAAIMPGGNNQPLAVFTNNGQASFTRTNYGQVGDVATNLAAADFDADGDLDLALLSTNLRRTKIYYNAANGDFSGTTDVIPAGDFNVLVPGDFNGDGSMDIVHSSGTPYLISTLLNRRKTPEISLKTDSINFGKVAVGNTKLFDTIFRNESGQAPLMITLQTSPGSVFQAFQQSLQIPPLDSAKVIFLFQPTSGVEYTDSIIVNSNDPVSPSLTITVKGVGVAKPAPPVLLSPEDNIQKQSFPLTLRWDSLTTADSYHLQVFKNSLSGPLIIDESGLKAATKIVNDLLHKTSYLWRVAAVNIAGKGDFSRARTFSTFTAGPTNLTAERVDLQNVQLQWNRLNETDIRKYYVYGGTKADALTKLDSTTAATDTTLIVNKIEQGRKYFFRVTAVDSLYRRSDFSAPLEYVSPAVEVAAFEIIPENLRSSTWGDFDNDGDLDLLIVYLYGLSSARISIYRNDGSALTEIWYQPMGAFDALSWGDFDGDGDLDILYKLGIFRNDGPATGGSWNFTALSPALLSEYPAFIDYDNDGDLDVYTSGANTSAVYRNEGRPAGNNGWEFTTVPIPNLYLGWKVIGDYDGDKRMDILVDGSVWHNDGGGIFSQAFVAPTSNLQKLQNNNWSPAYLFSPNSGWGDFDNDGDLDFCLIGGSNESQIRIYRNDGAAGQSRWEFSRFFINSPPIQYGSLAPGDFDNDGDLDILFCISQGGSLAGSILRNDGFNPDGSWNFSDTFTNFTGNLIHGAQWADYDKDDRLDAYLFGDQVEAKLWRNILPGANTPPSAPTALQASVKKDTVTLSWKSATDAQQGRRLSYNIFIEDQNGRIIMPAHADHKTGFRKIVGLGNAGLDTCWKVILPRGVYKWSVQAIDHSYAGSPFAKTETFTISTTAVADTKTELPKTYALRQNYPNPFNPSTTLRYDLPFRSYVRLRVFDALGNIVEDLIDAEKPAGFHSVIWNAKAASGIYFYRIKAVAKDNPSIRFEVTKKMVLIH